MMLVQTGRSVGLWFQQFGGFSAATIGFFSARLADNATPFRRRVIAFFKDFDLFTSLCLARFIIWRSKYKR